MSASDDVSVSPTFGRAGYRHYGRPAGFRLKWEGFGTTPGELMNRFMTILIAGAFAASLGACNKAEDPAETKADVAEAQSDASQDVAEAQSDASQDAMQNQENTAMATAEGDHKIATERCEALPGDQQKACKDQADADYEAAKAAAETAPPSS